MYGFIRCHKQYVNHNSVMINLHGNLIGTVKRAAKICKRTFKIFIQWISPRVLLVKSDITHGKTGYCVRSLMLRSAMLEVTKRHKTQIKLTINSTLLLYKESKS